MKSLGRRAQRALCERTHRRIQPPQAGSHVISGWLPGAPRGPVMYAPLGGQLMRVDRPSAYRDAIISRKLTAIKAALAGVERGSE